VLKCELSKSKGKKTSKQLADLKEKRSNLILQIIIWRPVQLAYTPHIATLLPLVNESDDSGALYMKPESTPLFFPSSLPPDIRDHPELKEICEIECRLCEPQAYDALADVGRFCRIIQGLWTFKKYNVLALVATTIYLCKRPLQARQIRVLFFHWAVNNI